MADDIKPVVVETDREFNWRIGEAHSDDISDADILRYLDRNIAMYSSIKGAIRKRVEATLRQSPPSLDEVERKEILPPVRKGHKRAYNRCRVHGRVGYHDYVPYSLSSAVSVMPCGCDTKGTEHISEDEFYVELAALSPAPATRERERIATCLDSGHQWRCDGEWHRGWDGHDPYAARCPKSLDQRPGDDHA